MSGILVTGATGNVGCAVVQRLLRSGQPVRAASRSGRPVSGLDGVRPVAFDFADRTTFEAALEGVDRVFLMRPPQMSDAGQMQPFIEAMQDAAVSRVVFMSVQGAGTNPFVPHHGIERRLRRSGLPTTLLRPSFFMQNLTTTHLEEIRDRGEIFVPAGRGKTNFIDIADIAEAAELCLTTDGHAGRAYEITGSEALTYAQVAETLASACGRKITYARPSAKEFKARKLAEGHPEEFVSVMSAIYAVARLGMAGGTTNDFERLVGHPPTTLKVWAERNAAQWREGSQ